MKSIDKTKALITLDNALSQTASLIIKGARPSNNIKNSNTYGSTIIEKNKMGFYDIKSIDKILLYENIFVFDIALIIANRYSHGEHGTIKQILLLEQKYSKYHTDMMHYLNCFKAAKKKNDIEKMCILEDKFQVAESQAKLIKDKIGSFKKVKIAF